jgi:hypothetical protein
MTRPVITPGQIWRRRVEQHDGFDLIEVAGEVPNDGRTPPEWTVRSAVEFGPVLGTSAEGITEFCTLISEPGNDLD